MKKLYILLIVALLSCAENNKEKKGAVEDNATDAIKQAVELSTSEVENAVGNTVVDFSGVYELIQGTTYMIGSENFEIYKAAMVIERLSETDFGFYSVYKRKEITPLGDFGVIRKIENNFHKLEICSAENKEGKTNNSVTKGLYFHNKVFVYKGRDILGIVQYGGNFRNYMLYRKKDADKDFHTSLVKTMKNTKLEYQQFLTDYKKAKNYDTSKLEIEDYFTGEIWKTTHRHKEPDAHFKKTHHYQNPHQDGKFIEYDKDFEYQFKVLVENATLEEADSGNSSFEELRSSILSRTLPFVENTNFDNFIEEEDYKKVDEKGLKLEKIYPDFYKEGHNYRAIASYRLEFSQKFHTVVVTILKGEHEMESTLINYDLDGNIIDSKVIAYDEIAEGMFKIESKIELDKLTINSIADMEEKSETIEVFKILDNGKITPIITDGSENASLVDNVIEQLKLNKQKIKTDLIVSKVQPNNSNETIVVIPEIYGEYDAQMFELNSYIVLVNNTTGKITHKYFESSKTNGWISDAVRLAEIKIDTAPYMVSENKRAFGIRIYCYNNSQPNPYSNKNISLFIKSGNTLKKVLHNYDVMNHIGEWDTNCAGEFTDFTRTLIMSEEKTNEYFDIIVKSKITKTKNVEDKNGECDSKETMTNETLVLKFYDETYEKKRI